MKLAAILVLLLGSVGLATPVSAQTYTLTAALSGSGEAPTPLLTGAFGTATVTVDMGTRTVTYRVDVFNLPSGVTAAHIHVGGIGLAGPVVVDFAPPTPASNDFSFGGTVRDSEFRLQPVYGIRSADDMFQAILGGNSYVNVHSAVNTGGEIRGQLVLKP